MARNQQGRENGGKAVWPEPGRQGKSRVGLWGGVTVRRGHTCECHITAVAVASADGTKFQFNTSNYRNLMGETTVTVAWRRMGSRGDIWPCQS